MLEISRLDQDLEGYWDTVRNGFFRTSPGSSSSAHPLNAHDSPLVFSADLYVGVTVAGREVYPDTDGGRDWLKGQVFAIGNCQGPRSFMFFQEEEDGDSYE